MLKGRIVLSYQGYEQHIALIQHGATIGDAKLWYDKVKKCFYLLVSLEIDIPEPACGQLNTAHAHQLQSGTLRITGD